MMFTGTPTPVVELPQFNPDDHPDFLTDFNQAFRDIDGKIGELITEIGILETRIATLEQRVRLQKKGE